MRTDMTGEEQAGRQKDLRHIQTELFSLQSDKSRLLRKEAEASVDIHRIRAELSHLQASLEEKEKTHRSLIREIELTDEVLGRLKKKMNAL